jgi:hypothetical protein
MNERIGASGASWRQVRDVALAVCAAWLVIQNLLLLALLPREMLWNAVCAVCAWAAGHAALAFALAAVPAIAAVAGLALAATVGSASARPSREAPHA